MNKIIASVCFLVVFINLSNAQKNYFKTGHSIPKNYYTEINYEDINSKIIIPVTIEGETYRFLFDTGAPNLISKNIWEKIGSKTMKQITVSDANQKKQRMELASIPHLTIGNVSFKNTIALVFNNKNNFVFDCFGIDGIIGSNLLRKSIVQIQSKQKLLILTNDSKKLHLNKKYASKLMLVGNQSSPYINIVLKGEDSGTENLLFDTGASGFYDLNKKNFILLSKKNIVKIISKGNGSSSLGMFGIANESEQYRVKIPELKINNQVFKNVITTTGNDNNSRIGSDILNYGIVTLNFIKKMFYFEAFKSVKNLNKKLFGFSPTISNNKLIVGFVWDDLLKDKIQYGDEIIEINNINIENTDICDLINKKSVFKENNTLELVFKNSKGEKNKLLVKKQFR
ncbi:hypothetical protein GCM10023311_01500 [Flaviramulus aquimarinus]|uniref:Aspartyl protease n=1 Tax=Flaviramulus aquimarinus TaxID=1170456 RepID=A0ABP9EMV7_9FLAO